MVDSENRRPFDGIICLGGEDWWYHNRGHFDFQIMRRIARHWPVLFVNSLGVRMPDPARKGLFAARMWRKAKSLAKGLVEVEPGFWVTSPLAIPGERGERLSGWALAPQIKLAARRAGIRNPVLWVHCPAGARLIKAFDPAAVVMQRTDRFEAFPEGDSRLIARQVGVIKKAADVAVYAAPHFAVEEAGQIRRACTVTHGVDFENFAAAGDAKGSAAERAVPAQVAQIPHPRAGFIGGIDAHTFDPALFLAVARQLPRVQFVMVGGCSLPEGWCPHPNVHFLGRVPYSDVARYMAAMDVLLMPWNRSEWIAGCNPIKLKEYLATGRPVITTDFPALDGWRDLVHVADGQRAFAGAIEQALHVPHDPGPARRRLLGESWDAKAADVMGHILDLGLAFTPRRAAKPAAALERRTTLHGARG